MGCTEISVGFLSILFTALGIGYLAFGGFLIAQKVTIAKYIQDSFEILPEALLISIGIVLLIGAIAGFCFCSCRATSCERTFCVVCLLIFVGLLTTLIISFKYAEKRPEVLMNEVKAMLNDYGEIGENQTTVQVDDMQKTFSCCGSDSYQSWNNTPFGLKYPRHVPLSCCKKRSKCAHGDTDQMGEQLNKYIYEIGCVQTAMNIWDTYKSSLLGVSVFVLVLMGLVLFGVLAAAVYAGVALYLSYKAERNGNRDQRLRDERYNSGRSTMGVDFDDYDPAVIAFVSRNAQRW